MCITDERAAELECRVSTHWLSHNDARDLLADRREMLAEIERLRDIIAQHNLCHDLHGKVDATDFAKGCAPDADEVERLRADLARLVEATGPFVEIGTFMNRLDKISTPEFVGVTVTTGNCRRLAAVVAELKAREGSDDTGRTQTIHSRHSRR